MNIYNIIYKFSVSRHFWHLEGTLSKILWMKCWTLVLGLVMVGSGVLKVNKFYSSHPLRPGPRTPPGSFLLFNKVARLGFLSSYPHPPASSIRTYNKCSEKDWFCHPEGSRTQNKPFDPSQWNACSNAALCYFRDADEERNLLISQHFGHFACKRKI